MAEVAQPQNRAFNKRTAIMIAVIIILLLFIGAAMWAVIGGGRTSAQPPAPPATKAAPAPAAKPAPIIRRSTATPSPYCAGSTPDTRPRPYPKCRFAGDDCCDQGF